MTQIRKSAVALLAAAALALPATPAGAAEVSDPLVEGLAGPLGLAVGDDGTMYVTQSFAGLVTIVDKRGEVTTRAVGGFPTGVAAEGRGTFTYVRSGEPPQGPIQMLPNGRTRALGDTSAIELGTNPDGHVTYGFQGLDPACAALFPEDDPASFPGDVNPNAYAVAILPDGSRVVADAGGNTLLRVGANGRVSVLSLLPPVPVTATAQVVEAVGLPPCVTDHEYWFHPVPTDVEVGPDGMLYVSSLAGGPEDAQFQGLLGGTGGVFRVNPTTGAATRIASGLLGAVDLAVAPNGNVYVAELYADRISRVVAGHPQAVAAVPQPGALEWANGTLYAAIGTFGNGQVVTIAP